MPNISHLPFYTQKPWWLSAHACPARSTAESSTAGRRTGRGPRRTRGPNRGTQSTHTSSGHLQRRSEVCQSRTKSWLRLWSPRAPHTPGHSQLLYPYPAVNKSDQDCPMPLEDVSALLGHCSCFCLEMSSRSLGGWTIAVRGVMKEMLHRAATAMLWLGLGRVDSLLDSASLKRN